ncbi:MAG: hypothetical protein HKN37_12735, partial [Rhodothermales bacterium]|nr:hypothetical protein [Rhodothermales bacterium]
MNFLAAERGILTNAFIGERDEERWFNQLGSIGRTATTTFNTTVGSGTVRASHESNVSDLNISASFEVGFRGSAGFQALPFEAESMMSTALSVTDAVVGSVTGTVELEGGRGEGVGVGVSVSVQIGFDLYEFDEDDLNAGPIPFSQAVTYETGSIYGFGVRAALTDALFDESLEVSAKVDLALNFGGGGSGGGGGGGSGTGTGDTDLDGLPDIWETAGINVDGDDDIEIDLPALGVLPNRKDLIVEVDVQRGSNFPLDVLSDVVDAFSTA